MTLVVPILHDEGPRLLRRETLMELMLYAFVTALLVLALASIAYGLLAVLWFLASLPVRWRQRRHRRSLHHNA